MIKCPNCERRWFEDTTHAKMIERTGKCTVCNDQADEEWFQSCVTVAHELEPGLEEGNPI